MKLSFEDIADFKMYGIDVENELASMLATEIDREIIAKLVQEATMNRFTSLKFKSFYDENYLNGNGSNEISTDI